MAERITTKQALQMRDALAEKPMTYDDLVALTGMGKPRVARWMKNNKSDMHIVGWAPDKAGRPFIAQYRWGEGEDLKRPGRALTPAEQMRKVRERRALAKLF